LRVVNCRGLPLLWHPPRATTGAHGLWFNLQRQMHFQEQLGGVWTVKLHAGLGTGLEVHEIDVERMRESMHWLQARAGG